MRQPPLINDKWDPPPVLGISVAGLALGGLMLTDSHSVSFFLGAVLVGFCSAAFGASAAWYMAALASMPPWFRLLVAAPGFILGVFAAGVGLMGSS